MQTSNTTTIKTEYVIDLKLYNDDGTDVIGYYTGEISNGELNGKGNPI